MINAIKSQNTSLKLNTQSTRPKTSSNASFQENIAGASRKTVSTVSDTFKKGFASVPGAPQLSAVLSQAANGLGIDNGSLGADPASSSLESIQSDMMQKQEQLIKLQAQTNEMTTEYTAKSNIIKAKSDTEKSICQNLK